MGQLDAKVAIVPDQIAALVVESPSSLRKKEQPLSFATLMQRPRHRKSWKPFRKTMGRRLYYRLMSRSTSRPRGLFSRPCSSLVDWTSWSTMPGWRYTIHSWITRNSNSIG